MNSLQRLMARGRICLEYDVRGCMAEDHVLKNVWEIVEFGDQRKLLGHPNAQSLYVARCRLIQSRDDLAEEYTMIPVDDIYPLPSGHHGQSLGYVWRH